MSHKHLYLVIFAYLLAACGTLPSDGLRAPVIDRLETSKPAAVPLQRHGAPGVSPDRERAAGGRAEALLVALAALDTDYRYGGASHAKGFDCSGLVAHVYRAAWGIDLPHNALAQSEFGTPIPADLMTPGDLVFYNTLDRPYSHVGIYLGDGKFIHAPKAGAKVRIESLRSRYWMRRFDGARRILPLETH